jgi:hypothetical protein
MTVIIGIDPHKASHTAVAIGCDEQQLAEIRVRATCQQTASLLAWAKPLGPRTWAVESAGGLGYLLSQQLVGAGEQVLDVPATLASRVRVLGTGRSNKNDPNDALSVPPSAPRDFDRLSPPTTGRFFACWPNATTRSAGSATSSSLVSTPPWPTSHQAELPRNSTLLTLWLCSVASIRLPQ